MKEKGGVVNKNLLSSLIKTIRDSNILLTTGIFSLRMVGMTT